MKQLQDQVAKSSRAKKVSPKKQFTSIDGEAAPIVKEECKVEMAATAETAPKKKRGPKVKDNVSSIASKVIIKKPRGRPKKDTKTVKIEAAEVNLIMFRNCIG